MSLCGAIDDALRFSIYEECGIDLEFMIIEADAPPTLKDF
jgi:hypothetical protein